MTIGLITRVDDERSVLKAFRCGIERNDTNRFVLCSLSAMFDRRKAKLFL